MLGFMYVNGTNETSTTKENKEMVKVNGDKRSKENEQIRRGGSERRERQ